MIKKLIRSLYRWFDDKMHTASLESDVVYRTKDKLIMMEWSSRDEVISVYIKGTIYNIPIEQSNIEEEYENFFNQPLREDISALSVSNLERLLKDYESLEYYEKCDEIKKILDIKKSTNDD